MVFFKYLNWQSWSKVFFFFSNQNNNLDQISTGDVDNENQEDENDDAVEIMTEQQSEDDNIAQHESENEDEQSLTADDEKLSQIDNFNVKGKLYL